MFKKYFIALAIVISITALLTGCSTQTSTGPETIPIRTGVYSYLGTQSPGDVWSWTIGEGTFAATNETINQNYFGTFISYASGFNKGTVDTSSDTSVPLDGTAMFYFLEYPNTMLIIAGEDENPTVCAARTTTAPSAGHYNFVTIPWQGWNASDSAYGTVEVTSNSGLYDFDVRSYSLNDQLTSFMSKTGFSFSDGKLSKTGDDLQIFLTPSGAFFGDNGPGTGGFCGAVFQNVDLSDMVSKNYRGLLFSYNPATGSNDSSHAIGAEPNTSLTNGMTGFGYEDVEFGTRSSGTVTLQFNTPDSSGILSGTMNDNGSVTNFKMIIAQVAGKYIIIGISVDSSGYPQNMLLVEI
jgi:hypothetical protein